MVADDEDEDEDDDDDDDDDDDEDDDEDDEDEDDEDDEDVDTLDFLPCPARSSFVGSVPEPTAKAPHRTEIICIVLPKPIQSARTQP